MLLCCALFLAQLQIVGEDVEGVVLIVWFQQLLLALLQVAVVFGDYAHRWANDEEYIGERDIHLTRIRREHGHQVQLEFKMPHCARFQTYGHLERLQ